MSHFDNNELEIRHAKMMAQTPENYELTWARTHWNGVKTKMSDMFGSRNDAVTGCLAASAVARDTQMEDAYAV